MTSVIRTFSKTQVEKRRLYIDYSCWLAAEEQLTDFQVTITPYTEGAALVPETSYPDAEKKRLMMFVSGGKANTNYLLSLVVSTDSGQIKRDDIGMKVMP